MRGLLGLSIGATQLVAARADGTSILRRAELPWRGTVLTGFVERVGDPVPIVAPDGSAHSADRLLTAARDRPRLGGWPAGGAHRVAVPAHWSAHVVDRVRALLPGVAGDVRRHRRAHGVARASRTARARHRGAVRLRRHWHQHHARRLGAELRTDRTDPALRGVLRGPDRPRGAGSPARGGEPRPRATSAVASLRSFRDQCRGAKERLSRDGDGLAGPVPGATVRLTRRELEALVRSRSMAARRRRRPAAARRRAACDWRPSRPWAAGRAFRLSRNVFPRRCAAR